METNNIIGVDIVQPIVPHYRVALIERLWQQPDLNLSLQVSCVSRNSNKTEPLRGIDNYFVGPPARQFGPFVWQPGLKLIKAQKCGDVLVVCGDVHYASNFGLIASARRRKIGVLWWGHHRSAFSKDWKVRLRLALVKRIADAVLCYTNSGVKYLETLGFPQERLFAMGNTIDTDAIDRECAKLSDRDLNRFEQKQGRAGRKKLLFCGRLTKKTNLDVMIMALAVLVRGDNSYQLTIIGDGILRKSCEDMARQYGVAEHIRWTGELTQQAELAPYFLTSDIFVYPGTIGLSLLHAFAYGLPVLTYSDLQNHGPEIEAMQDGVNGLLFERHNVASLIDQIDYLMADQERLKRMKHAARKTIDENYTMDKMVNRFKVAISGCSELATQK